MAVIVTLSLRRIIMGGIIIFNRIENLFTDTIGHTSSLIKFGELEMLTSIPENTPVVWTADEVIKASA
jgi:hypothetical protein